MAMVAIPVRILTVGDGDLTFSLALKRAFGDAVSVVVSTLLRSAEELTSTYHNGDHVVDELERVWKVPVLYGVDATKLDRAVVSYGEEEGFDIVMFNHPHLGYSSLEDDSRHAQRHEALLAHYFVSAKSVLRDSGSKVHVCLCGSQPKTWNVARAAFAAGLQLQEEVNTAVPLQKWLLNGKDEEALPVVPHYPAPRRYRNGKLGSKHFLGKYGYRHRRTHGDKYIANDTDMMVPESVNLIFIPTSAVVSSTMRPPESASRFSCPICGWAFDEARDLEFHLQSPAIPDPCPEPRGSFLDSESGKSFATSYALRTFQRQTEHEKNDQTAKIEAKSKHDVLDTTKEEFSTLTRSEPLGAACLDQLACVTVSVDHDGSRLRKFCRLAEALGVTSKKHCDDVIKGGLVTVNDKVATDSSRIVKSGDTVAVHKATSTSVATTVHETATALPNNQSLPQSESHLSGVRVVERLDDDLVVAYKPVGIRSCGSFSSDTLERIVASMLLNGTGHSVTSHTKLETGCAGLCLVSLQGWGNQCPTLSRTATYRFTALVHAGQIPQEWHEQDEKLDLPTMGARRWRKLPQRQQQSEGPGEGEKNADEVLDGEDEGDVELQVNAQGRGDEVSKREVDGESLETAKSLVATVRCIEQTTMSTGDGQPLLATLMISCASADGRLSGALCFALRRLGCPVVNDRYAKQGVSSLPRVVRNHVKNKLCIGCFAVTVPPDDRSIEIQPPERLSAAYWDERLRDRGDQSRETKQPAQRAHEKRGSR